MLQNRGIFTTKKKLIIARYFTYFKYFFRKTIHVQNNCGAKQERKIYELYIKLTIK